MIIQFICRGNAFRSIIAEAYLNSLMIPGLSVLSSGTVASTYKESNGLNFTKTLTILRNHGIGQFAKDHYADDVDQTLLDKSDVVIFLNKIVYEEVANSFKMPTKYYVWDVTDIGEKERTAKNETEREALSKYVYDEIVKNVDELVKSNGLRS